VGVDSLPDFFNCKINHGDMESTEKKEAAVAVAEAVTVAGVEEKILNHGDMERTEGRKWTPA
jgi:hypothetical protein